MIGTPIYFTNQQGSFWWLDISKGTLDDGTELPLPDPEGGIDQDVNENVVAGMMFKLWALQGEGMPTDPNGRGLGDTNIFNIFTFGKLVDGTFNRGYAKVDVVDYFDAALCSGNATEDDISAIIQTTGFPYDMANRSCDR